MRNAKSKAQIYFAGFPFNAKHEASPAFTGGLVCLVKTFYCDTCGALVFFENVLCLNCRHTLGFLPEALDLSALEPAEEGLLRALSNSAKEPRYRLCSNSLDHQVCNWLVPANDSHAFCLSCRLNEIIPNLAGAGNRDRWFHLERAKRRLIYELIRLGLPTESDADGDRPTLRFRFLESSAEAPVITGHYEGRITLDISEADDDERERRRVSLHEPYRTLLGHLRHEVGHYYWDRLIANSTGLDAFRALFGDETTPYPAALQAHYDQGPPEDWQSRHVSAYASAHPWEDWAETFAHYLHISDTLETAASFGLRLRPKHPQAHLMKAAPEKVVEGSKSFDELLEQWLPLTYALNSLNRGMGLPDLYPFVLSDPAVAKLRFVHETIEASRQTAASTPPTSTKAAEPEPASAQTQAAPPQSDGPARTDAAQTPR